MFEVIVDDTLEFRNLLSGGTLTIGIPSDDGAKKNLKRGSSIKVLLDYPDAELIEGKVVEFHGPTGEIVDGDPVYSVTIKAL